MAIIEITPTEEQIRYAKNLYEGSIEWHKKNNSEEYQRITNLSNEKLLEEYRYYRRINSGFCPIATGGEEDITNGLIISEIEKRNLGEKTQELVDFYIMFLDYERELTCSLCKKNKGKWLFNCDHREVVFCKECLLESRKDRKDLMDGCLRMVPEVPRKEFYYEKSSSN